MSKIEWTDKTWNPTTGCDKVSQGCKNCYAEIMHRRLRGIFPEKYSKPFLGNVETHPDELDKPKGWKKPCMVFVDSMSDLFHEDIDFNFIREVFQTMREADHHTYQVLTKRIHRVVEYINWWNENYIIPHIWPGNVWLGVSCEDQTTADQRIPILIKIPATVRFLSCEPLLGPIDLKEIAIPDYVDERRFSFNCLTDHDEDHFYNRHMKVDWVIVGGESGHKARPMHPDWVRRIGADCADHDVSFFFKQWGEWEPDSHVSYNGPFFIHGHKHYLVDLNGNFWPYGNCLNIGPGVRLRYSKDEDALADECPLTKEDNAWWMANTGKSKSGNFLDGKQHLEFPKVLTPCIK